VNIIFHDLALPLNGDDRPAVIGLQ
jgi:hypothetical protein